MRSIGVLALQGDVREHVATLTALGVEAFGVRRPTELDRCDGLVIPGGESTTMIKLARLFEGVHPHARGVLGGEHAAYATGEILAPHPESAASSAAKRGSSRERARSAAAVCRLRRRA